MNSNCFNELLIFSKCKKGSAAVETALVAPLFFLTLLFVFECGVRFFFQQALDSTNQAAARQIQTGYAESSVGNLSDFKTNIFCPSLIGGISCENVVVNVSGAVDFYAQANVSPSAVSPNYCVGAPNQLMLTRVVFMYPSFFSWFYPSAMVYNGHTVVPIVSSVAFMNEAFPATGGGSC